MDETEVNREVEDGRASLDRDESYIAFVDQGWAEYFAEWRMPYA